MEIGKREKLRNGEIVELKPGINGRLNKENRTLELDSGKVLPISPSDQRDLFPENEQALDIARKTEKLGKTVKDYPVGGDFLFQLGQSSSIGGIKDTVNYFTKSGDEYLKDKEAEKRVSGRISKESPWTSMAATAASIIPDIYATKGMSALKAAPLLSTVSAGSRAFTEPGKVAEEALLSAGAGGILDFGTNFVNKVVNRRAISQSLPAQQEAVIAENTLGKRAIDEANAIQNQEFVAAKENVKNQNSNLIHQHNLEKKLGQEKFNLNKSLYNEEIKKIPNLQKESQSVFSEEVVKNAKKISDSFPKGSKINSKAFGVNEFIDESINKSGLSGSIEGNQVQKIIKSIFQDGEIISGNDIVNKYKNLESAIQRSSPETRNILLEFKNYLGNKLPNILADNMAYNKIIPSLKKDLEKTFESSLKSSGVYKSDHANAVYAMKRSKINIDQLFDKLGSTNFIDKFNNGQIKNEIIEYLEKTAGSLNNKNLVLKDFHSKLDKVLSKSNTKLIATDIDASKKIGNKINATLGMSEKIQAPKPPIQNSFLKPQLMNNPNAPIPQTFNPKEIPQLPAARGFAEQTGDFLEKDLMGGRGVVNNPIAKLAGLKYLLGKAALPAELSYAAMKGLTSPTEAGNVARMTFKQGGIQAIESWAQKYPSYHDGILENPQERRSLTKEIEDAQDIPIEKKAILQSKVNRGKPVSQKL